MSTSSDNTTTMVKASSMEAALVNSVTQSSLDALIKLVEGIKITDETLKTLFEIKAEVEFQGFDVKVTQKALAAVFTSKYNADSNQFRLDLLFVIVLFINRGAVTQRTMNRMKGDGATRYNAIITKMGIQVSGRSLAPHILTLPRIAQAFPILTVKISKAIGGKNYVGPFKSHLFPDAMKNSAFAALIPQGNLPIKRLLATVYTCYSTDQSWNLSREKPKIADLKKMFENQLVFTEMAISGSLVDEKTRVSALQALEIPLFFKLLPDYLKHMNEVFEIEVPELIKEGELAKIFKGATWKMKKDMKNPLLIAFGVGEPDVESKEDEEVGETEEEMTSRMLKEAEEKIAAAKKERGEKKPDRAPK